MWFLGLLKSKRAWKYIGAGAVALGILLGAWYISNKIEDLSREVTQLEQKNASLESKVENRDQTIQAIQEQIQRVERANERIDQTIQSSQQELRNLRGRLEDLDLERLIQEDPNQTVEIFNTFFQNQLNCFEAVTGNEDSGCKTIDEITIFNDDQESQ